MRNGGKRQKVSLLQWLVPSWTTEREHFKETLCVRVFLLLYFLSSPRKGGKKGPSKEVVTREGGPCECAVEGPGAGYVVYSQSV